ncbi:uncharacterized protein LOC110838250 isoform X1 [Zootermopsis nevadensis]|uniref:uncharacterized protein LOC110838250 isoform X1 n=2 Tax=Zootermopsis nevadensis TaxID=136037 RepID=UPI000B8E2444|nr:uncharacterized protein LOC110838250 isoform X1 [Zootermopsis nevadensis]
MQSSRHSFVLGVLVMFVFGGSVAEVYDVTTIYKFYVPHYNSSYEDYTGQDFPDFMSVNRSGRVEVHAMTNARGLPVLLSNNTSINYFIGNDVVECTSLYGGCTWTMSNWTKGAGHNLPLILQEKSFAEYTKNNISILHFFHGNDLNFTYQAQSQGSRNELNIFLMVNNDISSGDMYYIKINMELYNYRYGYGYGHRHRWDVYLYKCTLIHRQEYISLPGGSARRLCNVQVNKNGIMFEDNLCDFSIHVSSGNLKFTSVCKSQEEDIFDWTDADPLDIVYYQFGSSDLIQFHVNTGDSVTLSLAEVEGYLMSPTFVPHSSSLCVSLTYYLPSTAGSSLKLSALWAGGDRLDFDTIKNTGEWKTQRFVVELPAGKQDRLTQIVLKGRKSYGSDVLVQRIAGCNGEGLEDILELSNGATTIDVRNGGYDVAVMRSQKNKLFSFEVTCINGGIFDEERGGCVCPSGFGGSTCEEACGANRFGAACEGLCSETRSGCQGMILCRPLLGCSCPAGLRGSFCDRECRYKEYGAGCKQKCGHCKDDVACDRYTGECPLGCEPGYYPPFCQQTYKYLSTAPDVKVTEYLCVTVEANLQNCKGRGSPRFYQLQYKEANHDLWLELEYRQITSNEITRNITGLKSGIRYQVRVVLLDKDGGSYQGPNILPAEIITKCAVPDSVHYDLQATEITEDSFQVTWKIVPESPIWCAARQFEVERKESLRWLKHYQGSEMTTTFSNMLPGQQYQIRVQALTNVGEKYPFSSVLLTTTKVGVPGKVHDIHLVSSTSQELEIKWKPPLITAGTIHRYTVSYQCKKLLACHSENCSHSAGQVEVKNTSTVLRGLLSHAQYSVSVVALSGSWGPASYVLAVTDMTVPGVTPATNFTSAIVQRTNSSFTIQWEPPQNCTYANGYLYEYRYELVSVHNSQHILEGMTHLTTVTLTNLTPHTQYMVKVFLVNSKGWSSSHPLEIHVQTRATTPDHVEQLMVYKKSRWMLGVRWAAPKHMFGSLESFIITYQAVGLNTMKSVIEPLSCVAWPHLYCHTANNLKQDTEYTVLVQAQNSEVDEAGESSSVTAVTKETAPLSPSFIRVVSQSQTNLTIEVGLPDMVNGKLRSFLVYVEETDSFNSTECCQYFPVQEVAVQVEKSSYNIEFTGLRPASTYAVSVSAKTVSLGPAVSITAHTRPPVPSMDDMIEIPDNSSYLSGSLTVFLHPSTMYQDLISGCLLLVLPQSSEVEIPKTLIFDEWLTQEVNNRSNGTYYFSAEFDQVSYFYLFIYHQQREAVHLQEVYTM